VTSTSLANTLSSYATQSWVTNQGYALQTSVDALEFLNSVSAQDNKVTLTTNKNNSTILDFTHEHVWSEILDKPSTLQGYGIFDTYIGSGVISINGVQITPLVLDDVTDKDVSLSYGTRSVIASIGSKDIHVTMPVAYSLPTASSNALGGVQIGFTTDAANRNYAVLLSGNKAYVNVPWTDTVYTHPSGGADTTISAANGRVLSAITVNGLGHTTSVSYKALTMADMPSDMKFFNAIANVNDGIIRFTGHNITAQDVDFYHEHTWADILDKPASLAGFGIDKNDPLLKENYLTIEFFERLFNAYNGENIVHANSTSTIDSIKAMFGFWTEQYISALGLGDDGEAGSFNESQMWNALGTSISVKRIASTYLEDATRFNAVTGGNNHINLSGVGVTSTALDLTHEHSWWEILDKPSSLQGYGIYDTYIEGTTVYIGGAHIDVVPSGSVDLTGYAKESWVSANYQVKGNYLTSADLSGYLPKIGGIMTGDISRRMTADTSNYENAIKWINFSAGSTIAAIGYHNTVQKIYLNPVGSSEIYNDAEGKYSLVIGNNELTYNTKTIIHSGNIGSQSVNYASSANYANYLSTYAADGNDDLSCLQNVFNSIPKSVATAVRLQHGSHSMAIGWFLSGYEYSRAYGGWFISDYGTPSWVGVDNGSWYSCNFITSSNIGSQSVNYATSAGSADYATDSGTVGGYGQSDFIHTTGGTITTNANSASTSSWALKIVQGTDNGTGQYDSLVISANDVPAIRISDADGTQLGLCGGDGHGTISSTHDLRFFVNGTANSSCYGGMSGTEKLTINSTGVGVGKEPSSYAFEVQGDIKAYNAWLRTSGDTGWYSDTYGGGWYMTDANWIRNYNSKVLLMAVSTNAWGGGGHNLAADFYQSSHVCIGLRNDTCGWYLCSNNNRNFYFAYRPTGSASGSSSDHYPCYIEPTGGLVSNYGVSALSDARHKLVIRNTNLSVEQIANMPSVIFKWNDGRDDEGKLHVGTLAQPWQQILPEVVGVENNIEKTLTLQYGVAALVSAITTARKVVDHEKEIAQLKNRVKALEDENEMLKTKLIA
jgi:hypothetical protein